MATSGTETFTLKQPLAVLELQLINVYVAGAGYDLDTLRRRSDEEARRVLAAASRYASDTLSEVEARAHYLRRLQGEP